MPTSSPARPREAEPETMTDAPATIERYQARFAEARAALPGAGLTWLDGLRTRGLAAFDQAGLPTPKWEDWKYTNLNLLRQALDEAAATPADDAGSVDAVPARLAAETAHRVVLVDGRLRPELSSPEPLPAGVSLTATAEAMTTSPDWLQGALAALEDIETLPLAALNTAFMADGYVLHLADGAVLDRPLEVVLLATGRMPLLQPRNLIVAESGSEATVLENHAGVAAGGYVTNAVTQVLCRPNASVRRCKLQAEAADATHIALLTAELARDARFANFELARGGRLTRSESRIALTGPGAELRLDGAYLARGKQHNDTTTWIDHRAGQTNGEEVYKGVLDDQARAVFRGRITVRPQAQQISGNQLNKTLLLADGAEIDSKPELEILADDVKCSHGATAGELDRDALFYLRSRGIPEAAARSMLIEAFLGEAAERIADEAIRAALSAEIQAWLADVDEGKRA